MDRYPRHIKQHLIWLIHLPELGWYQGDYSLVRESSADVDSGARDVLVDGEERATRKLLSSGASQYSDDNHRAETSKDKPIKS